MSVPNFITIRPRFVEIFQIKVVDRLEKDGDSLCMSGGKGHNPSLSPQRSSSFLLSAAFPLITTSEVMMLYHYEIIQPLYLSLLLHTKQPTDKCHCAVISLISRYGHPVARQTDEKVMYF